MNTIEYMTRLDVLPSGKAGVLILSAPMMDPEVHFMIFLAVQNLGLAMADAVVEVMIVEAIRFEMDALHAMELALALEKLTT